MKDLKHELTVHLRLNVSDEEPNVTRIKNKEKGQYVLSLFIIRGTNCGATDRQTPGGILVWDFVDLFEMLLSHIMSLSISFRKSTPPKNRQLTVYYH